MEKEVLFVLTGLTILMISFVSAIQVPEGVDIDSVQIPEGFNENSLKSGDYPIEENSIELRDTKVILDNLDLINEQISKEEIYFPEIFGFLMRNGNILIEISMKDSSKENLYLVIEELKLNSIKRGLVEDYEYSILISEEEFNSLISGESSLENFGTKIKEKEIEIKGKGIVNKVKLFIGKFFI